MKLTKSKLKQLIKEELQAILYEDKMCYSAAQIQQLTALEKKYPNRDKPGHAHVGAYVAARKKITPEERCPEGGHRHQRKGRKSL